MSGHSKWAQIKHKKAITDAKKSKVFTKASSLITVAVREKGEDPELNPKLKLAIEKARAINMPQDNIKRAIERGKGLGAGAALERLRYEAYGPHSVAFVIDAISDNKNRTLAEIKHILSQHNGKMAQMGAVTWMFEEKAELELALPSLSEQQELEFIELGAEDIQYHNSEILISSSPSSFNVLTEKLEALHLPCTRAEIVLIPKEPIALNESQKEEILTLLDALDEQNEVDEVYTNAEF
ncbi:MAG: YebC/PmpR family DNA-binding transcriptional regulator [Patescibacteria group bacterium]|nr:YebC/PmpR family DNA-binding transcriptional regulator [Patescibacteria group bacterium]MDE2438473.1 YebC/PmpR family DNA-binding transcriptional regulator [Patescibacteria group bacterium]